MKQVIAMLMALVASLMMMVAVSAPAEAATCVPFVARDQHEFSIPAGIYSSRLWVGTEVRAKQCQGPSGHWVDPVSYRVWYNRGGSHEGCGVLDRLESITFNGYFSDGRGRNYNPGPVNIRCDTDTENESSHSLFRAPNFRYCFGVPRYRMNVEVHLSLNPNPDTTLGGGLWNFIGPVRNEC